MFKNFIMLSKNKPSCNYLQNIVPVKSKDTYPYEFVNPYQYYKQSINFTLNDIDSNPVNQETVSNCSTNLHRKKRK